MDSCITLQSSDRGGRDNRTTTRLTHLRNGVLHAKEDSSQQHRHRAIPMLHGDLVKRADRTTDTGIVVNDVKLAEFLDGALNCALYLGFACYIGFVEKGAAA